MAFWRVRYHHHYHLHTDFLASLPPVAIFHVPTIAYTIPLTIITLVMVGGEDGVGWQNFFLLFVYSVDYTMCVFLRVAGHGHHGRT